MKIGIVGSGRIGPGLGALWARVGHRVVMGRCEGRPRSAPEAPIDVAIKKARPRDVAEADVVLLAVPPHELERYLEAIGPLSGRIVITPHRADEFAPDGMPLAAWLQERLPDARIVRAFENVYWSFRGIKGPTGTIEIPVSARDADAKSIVSALVRDLALAPRDAECKAYWPTVYLPALSA